MQSCSRTKISPAPIRQPCAVTAALPSARPALCETLGFFHNNLEAGKNLAPTYSMPASRDLEMVYQPAFRLDEHRIEFIEALARFRSEPYVAPNQWFAAAQEAGVGPELEMLALKCAIEGMRRLPSGSTISINVSPGAVVTQDLIHHLASVPLNRVVLEITEHDAIGCYATMVEALRPLRQSGVRVAIDDVGAGYSSFAHIIHLRPDYIKLDMSLSRGIDRDPVRRALASALITFAHQTGTELVAEGVETACELESLRDLGVTIIQGHVIARPTRSGDVVATTMGSSLACS